MAFFRFLTATFYTRGVLVGLHFSEQETDITRYEGCFPLLASYIYIFVLNKTVTFIIFKAAHPLFYPCIVH